MIHTASQAQIHVLQEFHKVASSCIGSASHSPSHHIIPWIVSPQLLAVPLHTIPVSWWQTIVVTKLHVLVCGHDSLLAVAHAVFNTSPVIPTNVPVRISSCVDHESISHTNQEDVESRSDGSGTPAVVEKRYYRSNKTKVFVISIDGRSI